MVRAGARNAVPVALLRSGLRRRASRTERVGALAALAALWAAAYARYRRAGLVQTAHERELLRTADRDAFRRHYNERVPTIEEEFALWGPFHQHRHEMRYDIVATELRRQVGDDGVVLDVGCGSALVADRLEGGRCRYVGLDFPAHHVAYARDRMRPGSLATAFVRGDGEQLPFRDGAVDAVVFSEVIEHLLRPELAVWEISRVLRDGGVVVLTTNNASEAPLRSPLANPLAWVEKMAAWNRPEVVSLRPWVWPEPVDPDLLPPGSGAVYLPHTHHLRAQTAGLLGAAGLEVLRSSSFEFPPPQARVTAWLDGQGAAGRRAVDVVEAVATRVPGIRRLGCHLLLVARKVGPPIAPVPPPGVWPGPFSP